MKIKETKFKDLKIIEGNIFYDSRGFFREIYQKKELKIHNPVLWCVSKSKKNVLRGLHLQTKNIQEKFLTVIKGKILDVAVDLRVKSKTYGKYFKIILSDRNQKSILVPAGFAHGFLSLGEENIVLYSNNNYRSKNNEVGNLWNNKKLKIKWPKQKLIISKKDKVNLTFDQFLKKKYKITK